MALIKRDAIYRASIIDAELGWPRGLALGRLGMIWNIAQEDEGKSTVKRRLILEWGCVEPEYAERFLELCCKVGESDDDDHIHFLEHRDGDRYFIVGNPKQIENLANARQQKSLAGKASAAARAAKKASSSNENSTGRSTTVETTVEQNAIGRSTADATEPQRNFNPSASALESELESSSPSAFTPLTPRRRRGDLTDEERWLAQEERKQRRRIRDRAAAIATKAIGGVRNGLDPDQAQGFVGEYGWALLMAKFCTWRAFEHAYVNASQKGTSATAFESQLKDSFRALMLEAPVDHSGGEI